ERRACGQDLGRRARAREPGRDQRGPRSRTRHDRRVDLDPHRHPRASLRRRGRELRDPRDPGRPKRRGARLHRRWLHRPRRLRYVDGTGVYAFRGLPGGGERRGRGRRSDGPRGGVLGLLLCGLRRNRHGPIRPGEPRPPHRRRRDEHDRRPVRPLHGRPLRRRRWRRHPRRWRRRVGLCGPHTRRRRQGRPPRPRRPAGRPEQALPERPRGLQVRRPHPPRDVREAPLPQRPHSRRRPVRHPTPGKCTHNTIGGEEDGHPGGADRDQPGQVREHVGGEHPALLPGHLRQDGARKVRGHRRFRFRPHVGREPVQDL
ncbi:MAG: 3-oxoacyl-[acyl-carrier-protein] synthase, KASIII, partial [uncultured Rubrobacteraceae bacterium]